LLALFLRPSLAMQLPANVLAEMRNRTGSDASGGTAGAARSRASSAAPSRDGPSTSLSTSHTSADATTRARQKSILTEGAPPTLLAGLSTPDLCKQPSRTSHTAVASTPGHIAIKKDIKMGWIVKQGGASGSLFSRESWKRRWAVLDQSRLVWSEGPTVLPKGEVFVKGATIDANPAELSKGRDKGFPIAVRHAERTLFFRVEEEAEHADWVSVLTCIAEGRPPPPDAQDSSATIAGRRQSQAGIKLGKAPMPSLGKLPGGALRPTASSLKTANLSEGGPADSTEWWRARLTQHAGYLWKQGGSKGGQRTWRRRYAVLQNGELLYYKDEQLKGRYT